MMALVELSSQVRKQVCRDGKRKYYRFRKTKYYGGCGTADCLGCNLRCVYCWSQKKVWNPDKYGNFYTSKKVSQNLLDMHLPLVRISGGEPTLCKDHLLKLISSIPNEILFILETNGILIDEDYAEALSQFPNLYVRVSLKGVDEKSFQKITGMQGDYFKTQLNCLKLLKKHKIRNRAAILIDLFTDEQIDKLGIVNLEYENLIEYPFITKSLQKRGIKVIKR